ncbi:hypothetical protein [Clavibacter sp. MX14-G9D]|uniref:hypothetical protein n=1 Tax=Clavibacter sp. MX14-G9D TaxID=3064656 RepID=UPI00293E77D7|nr:hypothetical protein [Clavibacter sp. MX14-G9D]
MGIRATSVSLLLVGAALSGCAAGADDVSAGTGATSATPAPVDELTARTFVMDTGDGAELCLGGVGESLPPSCGGPDAVGWDWAAVEDEETLSGSTWGHYEVHGTWDGTAFTLTRTPVSYDPRAASTPLPDPTPGVPADPAAIARAMEDHSSAMGTPGGPLWLGEYQGRVSVGVIHDDGTQQAAADAEYGEDVVEIHSALRPAEGD